MQVWGGCFKTARHIAMQNLKTDGWAGDAFYSSDSGETWVRMDCPDCTDGSGTNKVQSASPATLFPYFCIISSKCNCIFALFRASVIVFMQPTPLWQYGRREEPCVREFERDNHCFSIQNFRYCLASKHIWSQFFSGLR